MRRIEMVRLIQQGRFETGSHQTAPHTGGSSRHRYRSLLLLLFLGVFWGNGCGGDDAKPIVDEPITEIIELGWSFFTDEEYVEAAGKFDQALSSEPGNREALLGRGWCRAKMHLLDESAADLESASSGSTQNDADAGLAFVELARRNHEASLIKARGVLERDPSWSFTHVPELDARALRILIAQASYATGDLAGALEEVREHLNPAFDADISTAEGRNALAAEIERLYEASRW